MTARTPGFTTQIVHADQHFGVEHGGIHKPIHTSVQYGYEKVEDLIGVFQGTLKGGYNYARQVRPPPPRWSPKSRRWSRASAR